MKIAILSMQRIVNFGSVLQAYSLRDMIREITGETADFLDIEDTPALPSKRTVKEAEDYAHPAAYSMKITQKLKRRCITWLSALCKCRIRSFMKRELKLDAANSSKKYSHVVVGSDEVFNHVKDVRLQLHGDVKQAEQVFTYAASCGSARFEDISAEDVTQVRSAMARFSGMSLRDAATEEYVSRLYDGETQRHMDPVLTGNLYKRRCRKPLFKNYILIYAYGQRIRTAEEIDAIKSFAGQRGLKTIAVGGSQFWCDLYLPLSPFRVLDYFRGADYVVTDTFHGTIFSIINHRKFAVLARRSNVGKIASLLKDFGLENHRVEDMSRFGEILNSQIDYSTVEEILSRERVRARDYLRRKLKV